MLGALFAPLVGPEAVGVGAFVGASAGGWLGDLGATGLVNLYDSGILQNGYNDLVTGLSNAGDQLINFGNWLGSHI